MIIALCVALTKIALFSFFNYNETTTSQASADGFMSACGVYVRHHPMQQQHSSSSSAFAFPHQQQQHVSARTTELLSDAIIQLQSTLAIAAAIMPKVRST
jgi:hypothetical protein